MRKHTPGPWKAGGIYVMDDERTIAIVDSNETAHKDRRNRAPSLEEAYANARLIAAAPDLLEAIEAVLDRLFEMGNLDPVRDEGPLEDLQNVISQAKGGE